MRRIPQTVFPFALIGSILGVIVYFIKKPEEYVTILILCAGLTLLYSILNVIFGDQNNLVTEIATIIVGIVFAYVKNLNPTVIVALFLCAAELVFVFLPLLIALLYSALMLPLSIIKGKENKKSVKQEVNEAENKEETEKRIRQEKINEIKEILSTTSNSFVNELNNVQIHRLEKDIEYKQVRDKSLRLYRFCYEKYRNDGVEAARELQREAIRLLYENNKDKYIFDTYFGALSDIDREAKNISKIDI